MQRSALAPIRLASAAALLFVTLLFSPRAFADDKAATKAMDDAANAYLEMNIKKATDTLNKAIKDCGADKCSAAVRAQLHSALGSILFLSGDKDGAKNEFTTAVKTDPNAQPDKNYKTKDIEEAFAQARQAAGGKAPEKQPEKRPEAPAGEQPTGDFKHEAPAEGLVRTPFPIYATYSGSSELAKVAVRYKAYGMTDWKQLPMSKMGDGYGVELPCIDMQQGQLQYYIQGFDANNDPVANTGDRKNPFKVAIKNKIEGEPPAFPGKEPPKQCTEATECPPDFPGCAQKESALKGEGESCEEDSQCKSGSCKSGECTAAEEGGEEGKPKKMPRLWIGIAGSIDFALLSDATDACLRDSNTGAPVNSQGYFCTDPNNGNVDYPSGTAENKLIQPHQKSDQVKGGFAPGNIRVMVSADYAFSKNVLLGVRLGYVLGTYPGKAASDQGKTFVPFHGELRGTYLFGKDALVKPGFSPMVFIGGGVSEFDAPVKVTVIQTGTNGTRDANAWGIAGPGFIAVGAGGRFSLSSRSALTGALKASFAFGGNPMLPVLSPEIGLQFGF